MSVSLRSMLPPLGFRLTEMNVGYVGKRPGPHRHPGVSGGGVYALDQGYQRGMLVRNSSRSTSWVGPVSIRYCQATVLPAQPGL